MTTIMTNREYLQAQGFEGFKTVGELINGINIVRCKTKTTKTEDYN